MNKTCWTLQEFVDGGYNALRIFENKPTEDQIKEWFSPRNFERDNVEIVVDVLLTGRGWWKNIFLVEERMY